MVGKRWLFLTSALLWGFASSRILPKGVSSVIADHRLWVVMAMLLVFVGFFMMFMKVSGKYSRRIAGLDGEKFPLYRFMSLKGYLIIGFMMSLGITLGLIPGVPTWVFAVIYPGLGLGLFSGAMKFLYNCITWKQK